MSDWIQSQPAHILGRIIAHGISGQAVADLMNYDGIYENNNLENDEQRRIHLEILPRMG